MIEDTITWHTEEPHYNNEETMSDYISNHNMLDITHFNGTYAEGVNCKGDKYSIQASGDGDSFNHKVELRLIGKDLLITSKIINQIANPDSLCPTACPNSENKPEGEGCGLDVCLDQIYELTKELNK